MKCPKCGHSISIVVDSRRRSGEGRNNFTRRRRECDECRYRWTTYERIDMSEIAQEPGIRPLHEVLGVVFESSEGKIRADARELPGTPPVGIGENRDEALYDLLSKLIWDWNTWGKYVLYKTEEEWKKIGA